MSKIIIDLNDTAEHLQLTIDFLRGAIAVRTGEVPITEDEVLKEAGLPLANGVTDDTAAAQQFTKEELAQGVDVDAAGYPWDERIHAGTKTKKTNGEWKLRKGVDKDLVVQIQTELRSAIIPHDTSLPMEPSPVAQAATANAIASHGGAGDNPFQRQPVGSEVPASDIVPTPPNEQVPTWAELLQRITAAAQAGTLDNVKQSQFLEANGITGGLPLLATRPDLFNLFITEMGV